MLKPALTSPIDKKHLARKSAEKVAARKAKHQPAYIAALHALPCLCTGRSQVEVHHILEGRMSMGGLRDDRMAIPLSPEVHREAHDSGQPEELIRQMYGFCPVQAAADLWAAWTRGEDLTLAWAEIRSGRAAA